MYVTVNKDGTINVSDCYPTRIGYVEYRNDEFHHEGKDRLNPFEPKEAILREMVHENNVKEGFVEVWDYGEDHILGTIKVTKDMLDRWYVGKSKLKPETIKILGLDKLTWEDDPYQI